jgi:hypothetical protein
LLQNPISGLLTKLDTNKDNQVSLKEWKAAGLNVKEFVLIDLNMDGYITSDEYKRWETTGETLFIKLGKEDYIKREILPMPKLYYGPNKTATYNLLSGEVKVLK